ncbi:hypothetical protein FE257_002996 [Aspergillus nanangensis]|uniref:Uncharacterized protein n=1 Tax=Aspergillus nanangensis TaxID=2582783 RepID=A0AAD4CDH4_ASPNN|nr:hypothetical protein FE257_002996 [Aspergillus nanangensis]
MAIPDSGTKISFLPGSSRSSGVSASANRSTSVGTTPDACRSTPALGQRCQDHPRVEVAVLHLPGLLPGNFATPCADAILFSSGCEGYGDHGEAEVGDLPFADGGERYKYRVPRVPSISP